MVILLNNNKSNKNVCNSESVQMEPNEPYLKYTVITAMGFYIGIQVPSKE